MNKNLYIFLLLAFIPFAGQAQYIPDLANDINPPYTGTASLVSSRTGSAHGFYNNLNNWIPYTILAPNEPLKNPPITEIEISFHVFLDDNGGNNSYTPQTKGRLLWAFDLVNQIYAGYNEPGHGKGSSDPIPGLVELPDCDTRIRFTLGEENNERIYFYNNTNLNANGSSSILFENFLRSNFPERSTKLNVYFTAGYYGSASGYANYPDPNLSFNQHVVICQSHNITNDWILGMVLAHELGHNLNLTHTYCEGGAPVVCCSNTCSQGCTKTTNTSEYLSDIFGPITNSTCPHIANWVDPFDNTMPNAEKITNNLMGGSHAQRYISPMQAGMMHRTLALKSTRKYVKKGTYSPIPLVINSSEVWDFNLKLYRDVVVSSGATLTLTEPFELPYNGTITVSNGAILIIENMAKLIDNNKIIVQAGGILKLESGSSIDVNNGHLEIQSGGKLILNSSSKFSVALGSTLTVELGGEILYL